MSNKKVTKLFINIVFSLPVSPKKIIDKYFLIHHLINWLLDINKCSNYHIYLLIFFHLISHLYDQYIYYFLLFLYIYNINLLFYYLNQKIDNLKFLNYKIT